MIDYFGKNTDELKSKKLFLIDMDGTIYRENRNFCVSTDNRERAKQETAARLMKEACKKYKDVYFIVPNASLPSHDTSVDGTHPDDYGYTLWAEINRKTYSQES